MKRQQYTWQLPEAIEVRLGDASYGRQRAMFEEGHLLIILHAPPGPDDATREPRVFLRTPEGQYLCNGQENGEPKLRLLLSAYEELYDKCDDACDAATTPGEHAELLETVMPLNRSSTNLCNALQAAREYVKGDRLLIAMRDAAYELSRNFELLTSDAKLALDYHIARNAEIQAARSAEATEAQHKLNILAALTFPLMALATLFGMNLTHGVEDQTPAVFWLVFGLGLITGLLTKGWVTKGNSSAGGSDASASDLVTGLPGSGRIMVSSSRRKNRPGSLPR